MELVAAGCLTTGTKLLTTFSSRVVGKSFNLDKILCLLVSVDAVYLSIYVPFDTLALFNNSNETIIPKIPNKGLQHENNDNTNTINTVFPIILSNNSAKNFGNSKLLTKNKVKSSNVKYE